MYSPICLTQVFVPFLKYTFKHCDLHILHKIVTEVDEISVRQFQKYFWIALFI